MLLEKKGRENNYIWEKVAGNISQEINSGKKMAGTESFLGGIFFCQKDGSYPVVLHVNFSPILSVSHVCLMHWSCSQGWQQNGLLRQGQLKQRDLWRRSFSTVGGGLGRFDFQKFCLIFAPGVSIILFCI